MPVRKALCFIACSLLTLTACAPSKRVRYLIPDGYIGWVKIEYKVSDAPALPVEDGYKLMKFPPDGRLQTSNGIEYEAYEPNYFYYAGDEKKRLPVTGWGGGGMIWGGFNGSRQVLNQPATTHEYFFVGSEEQYNEIGARLKDEDLDPLVGPIEFTKLGEAGSE
jgi:hypothetical protein